uniref:Sodium-dependent nutrient amino acid transporter 1 n=1 Tax=Glossina austeni TaxID=7395 RepID=A0A1A9UIQ3_GLOAU
MKIYKPSARTLRRNQSTSSLYGTDVVCEDHHSSLKLITIKVQNAGFTIFGILGHLAHEIGTDDIGSVVNGDARSAFISYPNAIAKFENLPPFFSVLFLMLFLLGIGSNMGMNLTLQFFKKYPNLRRPENYLLWVKAVLAKLIHK